MNRKPISWKYEFSFDTQWNREIEVNTEHTNKICEGLSSMKEVQVTKSMLRNMDIIRTIHGQDVATNAYAPLCDDSPFRYCEVRCAVFRWEYGDVFLDRADFNCPIYRQINEACDFVKRHLRLQDRVRGLYREDRYEIPLIAVREAIVNAVQHRSYVDRYKPIFVALYDDRLEVRSPGGIPS